MSQRTFFYCRVSTTEQTVSNQVLAFKNHGYEVNDNFVVSENVSGAVTAMERQEFRNLYEHKLYDGDTLVVLKLDRLGRDNIDVQNTIEMLINKGVKVHCLDLPTRDLSTAEGKLMLQMFSAFAEFERSRIRERVKEGLARAKAEGRPCGRPPKATPSKVAELRKSHSLIEVAKLLGISVSSVKRLQAEFRKK
ncbi:recombinase family protein [Pseudoalteromonas sp. MB47]|uniref:recombinase family protein n=1 Tax=Pseudoalteromonas sp. MB47 TaxID=2588452 RepID=UPI00140E06A6|nr:recombinase family protein [Pseudoalteromonas sp. MB47]NHH88994.1 Serine recombinase PinR [Pseudoalteromonas sp. MB47]